MSPLSEPSPASSESVPPPAASESDRQQQRRSRFKLLAIFALFGIPLLLATVWLQLVQRNGGDLGSTSRGQLIQPAVPLEPFVLSSVNTPGADTFGLDDVRGLWTLLYAPVGDCAEVCELNLYHMRQVRLALNHRMDRVQRAVLVSAGNPLVAPLIAEHPGLVVASGTGDAIDAFRGQISAAQLSMDPLADAIYLIDPLGNLMMRFPPDLPPKSLLKDLKHLLKVSRIG